MPVVDPADAVRSWDADLDRMLALLRDTPADTPVPNWSVQPDTAGWWVRRTAQELTIHRHDGDTLCTPVPDPVPTDLARDGIAEYFDVFVATGLAAGMVPAAEVTLVRVHDLDESVGAQVGITFVTSGSSPGGRATLR